MTSPGYGGARRDTVAGRRLLAAVESKQGPRLVASCAFPGCPRPWEHVAHRLSRRDHPELTHDPDNVVGACAFHNTQCGAKPWAAYVAATMRADAIGKPSRDWGVA